MMKPLFTIALILATVFLGACLEEREALNKVSVEDLQTALILPPAPFNYTNTNARLLQENWNLVSFPITDSMTVENFLAPPAYDSIDAVWRWDSSSNTWEVYPQIGEFNLLNEIHPDQGYWIRTSDTLELTGQGVALNSYTLEVGWNLIGYSHSVSSNQTINTFFNSYLESDSCELQKTLGSVWAWQENSWVVYFPGDTESDHPSLDNFNAAQKTSFSPLTELQPGMGIWVEVSQSDSLPAGCSTMEVVDLGNNTSFTLPENTTSFVVHAYGPSNRVVGVTSISNPSGQNLFQDYSEFFLYNYGYANALVPMIPSMAVSSGNWNFTASRRATSFKLTYRTGTPSTSTLDVQAYITGTAYTTSQVQSALNVLKDVYEGAGLMIELKTPITVSGSQYTVVDIDFTDSTTSALVSQGAANAVNLFFAEDLSADGAGGLLGIASGIPGSIGITGSYNGVLVGLEAHRSNNSLDTQLLGETAAHEMGHWLGLFHTTESNGASFDPLDDTPECSSSNPSVTNCYSLGGDNLMFWQASQSIRQTKLTSDQIHVITNSPIAR